MGPMASIRVTSACVTPSIQLIWRTRSALGRGEEAAGAGPSLGRCGSCGGGSRVRGGAPRRALPLLPLRRVVGHGQAPVRCVEQRTRSLPDRRSRPEWDRVPDSLRADAIRLCARAARREAACEMSNCHAERAGERVEHAAEMVCRSGSRVQDDRRTWSTERAGRLRERVSERLEVACVLDPRTRREHAGVVTDRERRAAAAASRTRVALRRGCGHANRSTIPGRAPGSDGTWDSATAWRYSPAAPERRTANDSSREAWRGSRPSSAVSRTDRRVR